MSNFPGNLEYANTYARGAVKTINTLVVTMDNFNETYKGTKSILFIPILLFDEIGLRRKEERNKFSNRRCILFF